MQVRAGEQRVVVEHLLEVGDHPAGVDRVAGEAAADLVVHPAARHRAQRVQGHLALPAREQELDRRRRRELRRALVEAAVLPVVAAAQLRDRLVEHRGVEVALRGRHVRRALQPREQPLRGVVDLVAALGERVGHRHDHLRPRRHALARLGREVGARVERRALRREEGVERPAAAARERLDGVHVDRVDVRALLAVDLDADEALVHQRRDLRVLEALPLHHVAPVAGGVADRDEERLALLAGAGERLVAPRVPVDGVAGVLQEVRGGLARESVHIGMRLTRTQVARPTARITRSASRSHVRASALIRC